MSWICALVMVLVACFATGFAAGAMMSLYLTHGGSNPAQSQVIVTPE